MSIKVTILGCGTSGGVPTIGDRWGTCDPKNPKNRRLRASVAVALESGETILIDTSPDLRAQLLDNHIHDVDAVLYTHQHADHTHGLNDLGVVSRLKNKEIPVYGDEETLDDIVKSFGYAFYDPNNDHYLPFLKAHIIDLSPFSLFGQTIEPFRQDHGIIQSLGFKIGAFAYSTDVCRLDDTVLDHLQGKLDVWVVDCLRYEPHRTHSHLAQTLQWIEHVKPKRAILTHMCPYLDYDTLAKQLPDGVEPGYDGLSFRV